LTSASHVAYETVGISFYFLLFKLSFAARQGVHIQKTSSHDGTDDDTNICKLTFALIMIFLFFSSRTTQSFLLPYNSVRWRIH